MVQDGYWQGFIDQQGDMDIDVADQRRKVQVEREANDEVEYVHMELMDGTPVRFKRVWAGYRFTDEEVQRLMAGMEISITTNYARGIIGSLDWQEYNGYEYFGFAPWDAEAYSLENAPFPLGWSEYVFSEAEEAVLRTGEKLLIMPTSKRMGSPYAVQVSFDIIESESGYNRWGIVPHFEEFHLPACEFTRETCLFTPMFSGRILSLSEIETLRRGDTIPFKGTSRAGKPYACRLQLVLDREQDRWRLEPIFNRR